jgi:hypothetical protein
MSAAPSGEPSAETETDRLWLIWAVATGVSHGGKSPTQRLQIIEHMVEREWLTVRATPSGEPSAAQVEAGLSAWMNHAAGYAGDWTIPPRRLEWLRDIVRVVLAAGLRATPGSAGARPPTPDATLLEALKGVVRVADRATVEFDVARAAIAKAEALAARSPAEPGASPPEALVRAMMYRGEISGPAAEAILSALRASPPHALVEKWAALATSGDGRHPEAAETLSRCASELKGALAARPPAEPGASPPDVSGSRDAVDRFFAKQAARSPAPAGDAPREDALRAMAQEFVDLYGGRPAPWGYWAAKFAEALRGAVSPSPGTRAASEGEA